jgi:hypothetical protein
MAKTKSEVLAEFLKSKVREATKEHAAGLVGSDPSRAQAIMREMHYIAEAVGYDIAHNAYGRMELEDILRWKIRRPHWD